MAPLDDATGPHLLEGELVCPRCGNDVFEAVTDGTETHLLCHRCWTCWHVELGYMAPVPVLTCPGCPHKEECLRRRATSEQGEASPNRRSVSEHTS